MYVGLIPFPTTDNRLHRLGELGEVWFEATGDPEADQKIVQDVWHGYEEYFQDKGILVWAQTHRIHVFVEGCAWTDSPEKVARACSEIFTEEDAPMGALILKFHQHGAILHGIEDPDLMCKYQDLLERTSRVDFFDPRPWAAFSFRRNRAIVSTLLLTVPEREGGIVFFSFLQMPLLRDQDLLNNFEVIRVMPTRQTKMRPIKVIHLETRQIGARLQRVSSP